jgi:hypothetical protein
MKEKKLMNYTIGVYDPYLRPLIFFSDYPGGEWVRKYSSYYRNLYKTRKVKLFRTHEEYDAAFLESNEERMRSV